MSNKELDNLFKNKLEEFDKLPSRDLWQSIDDELDSKKKKPIVWFLSIAASILLLVAISVSWYLNDGTKLDRASDMMALNDNKRNLDNPIKADPKVDVNEEASGEVVIESDDKKIKVEEEKSSIDQQTKTKITPIKKEKSETVLPEKNEVSTEDNTPKILPKEEPEVIEVQEMPAVDISKTENVAQINSVEATTTEKPASTANKSKTFVFDISEFKEENVLAKIEIEEEKKESKLKQLFNLAKDIKQGESGLKEVREAKNELFALRSKKDSNGK